MDKIANANIGLPLLGGTYAINLCPLKRLVNQVNNKFYTTSQNLCQIIFLTGMMGERINSD